SGVAGGEGQHREAEDVDPLLDAGHAARDREHEGADEVGDQHGLVQQDGGESLHSGVHAGQRTRPSRAPGLPELQAFPRTRPPSAGSAGSVRSTAFGPGAAQAVTCAMQRTAQTSERVPHALPSHPAAGQVAPAEASQLERELRATVKGEVRFDAKSRALYATDASPYRIVPLGVVVPLDDDDVRAAVAAAARHGAPIRPRGGGTSVAGQTVGEALVIDVSKHLTALLELNLEERWVRVQPGLVRDQLNAML